MAVLEAATVTGITEPILDATMAFPVTGIVTARHFQEGAAVGKGEVIIELDKRLEELDVQRRKLAMQLAEAELKRLETLATRNTISVSREEIDKKRADFEISKVEYELALEMVRRRQLVAPMDGFIAEFYRDIGEACDEERAPVVRLVDTRRCHFVSDCDPAIGLRLTLGQRVALEFDGREGPVQVEGTVSYVAPIVEPASGLLRVKVLFDNPGLRIRPGIAGRMRVN